MGALEITQTKNNTGGESIRVFFIHYKMFNIRSTKSHALVIADLELNCKAPPRITPQSAIDLDAQQHNAVWYSCHRCNAPQTPLERKIRSSDRWLCRWPGPPAPLQTSEP